MDCRMSVKLHFLCSHLDFFQKNLGDFSEEHGERFHQNIEPMERRYKGRWDSAIRDVAAAPQTPQLGGAQANFGGPS